MARGLAGHLKSDSREMPIFLMPVTPKLETGVVIDIERSGVAHQLLEVLGGFSLVLSWCSCIVRFCIP